MSETIYLDNVSGAPPSAKTVEECLSFLTSKWGNPYAPSSLGEAALKEVKKGYDALYALIGASDEETVIFTSSGAEGVNQVFHTCFKNETQQKGKNHYLTLAIDEAPAILSAGALETEGCLYDKLPIGKGGRIEPEAFEEALTPRTALLSLSWACGLTGVVQPVFELAAICKERGIALHLDATHILGKLFFDYEGLAPDFLTFNGDQLHAPPGTGALFVHKKQQVEPLIVGGMEQGALRGGSFNLPGFMALSHACSEAIDNVDFMTTEVARLRDQFEANVVAAVKGAEVLFGQSERLPHISCISFPGIHQETLLFLLREKGVVASFGGGGMQKLSPLLQSCGIDQKRAQCALSFSLSRETTEEALKVAVDHIVESVLYLKSVSGQLKEVF